jgi:hypothetical protein
MGKTYKPRHEVLEEFCKVILEFNPMELNLTGNPGVANEYDQEATSILARLNESAIQCCTSGDTALDIATGIVQESFVFWFNEPIRDLVRAKELTVKLLALYRDSYPDPEQPEDEGVVSAP